MPSWSIEKLECLIYYLNSIHPASLYIIQLWAPLDYHEVVPGDFELTEPFNHTVIFLCSEHLPVLSF